MSAKVQFVACMCGQGVLFEGPQKGQNESKTIVLLSVVGFHGPLLGGRHSSLQIVTIILLFLMRQIP